MIIVLDGPTPLPGSDEALDAGCLCPVLDNCHGKGFMTVHGRPEFWINARCPLHADPIDEALSGDHP